MVQKSYYTESNVIHKRKKIKPMHKITFTGKYEEYEKRNWKSKIADIVNHRIGIWIKNAQLDNWHATIAKKRKFFENSVDLNNDNDNNSKKWRNPKKTK